MVGNWEVLEFSILLSNHVWPLKAKLFLKGVGGTAAVFMDLGKRKQFESF